MSKRIKTILIFTIGLLLIGGCNSTNIPESYLRNPKEVKKGITGCWIEITAKSNIGEVQASNLSGELIAIQSDTLYILSEIQLTAINKNNLATARLYIFKNQGPKYALNTGLLITPNIIGAVSSDYGVEFMTLAIPIALTGIIITIIEGTNKRNLLIYPAKNSIDEFTKFSRFPMGIPPGLDKNELHLLTKK
jgi:hypothetical protein